MQHVEVKNIIEKDLNKNDNILIKQRVHYRSGYRLHRLKSGEWGVI